MNREKVTRTQVTSSNIAEIGWTAGEGEHGDLAGTLEVKFKTGKVFRYHDVPRSTFDNMLRVGTSVGRVFHSEVRGIRRCELVETEAE